MTEELSNSAKENIKNIFQKALVEIEGEDAFAYWPNENLRECYVYEVIIIFSLIVFNNLRFSKYTPFPLPNIEDLELKKDFYNSKKDKIEIEDIQQTLDLAIGAFHARKEV